MPETEDLLNAWVESVSDYAIFLMDAGGKIASWNRGAERILGYAEAEAIGRGAALIFTPEDVARGAPEWEIGESLRVGRATDDRWHVRKDGTRFWASGILTALRDEAGNVRGFVKALRDLTERKRLEDDLRRQAEELRELDRRKNQFLAILSHELRNPLAPILNSVYVLREQFPTEDPIVVQARETIERQVTHLKRMVDDLMDVARAASDKIRLDRRPVALAGVLEHAAEDVGPLVAERKHSLTVTTPPAPIWVEADPIRLAQVVVNLLTNAAKYTEPGGSLWLMGRRRGREAEIRVRDTGLGIDPEMLPRVFDLFVQAERSLGRAEGGLGIGLALTRSLVELHGGTIEVHSEGPGRGSEFVVRLPALEVPASSAAGGVAPSRARPGRVLTILVVEDDPDTARTLGLLLGRLRGHRVHLAHDGPTALELATEHPPDAVVLDIGLPGMDGYEVARQIRHRTRAPLIALTGYVREEAATPDFDAYLVKPVNPEDLLKILDDLT